MMVPPPSAPAERSDENKAASAATARMSRVSTQHPEADPIRGVRSGSMPPYGSFLSQMGKDLVRKTVDKEIEVGEIDFL